jgi:peroxiredoxin Q/BCP
MPPPVENPGVIDQAGPASLRLQDESGQWRGLADFRGQHLVLYFYPSDDTPGCTIEGKEFRDLNHQFASLNCAVVGVSTDSVESHRAFAQKHALPFTLLADCDRELARTFGVLEGKRAKRVTFVIAPDGRVLRDFRDVAPRGHAQQVLNFVRTLLESRRMLGG